MTVSKLLIRPESRGEVLSAGDQFSLSFRFASSHSNSISASELSDNDLP